MELHLNISQATLTLLAIAAWAAHPSASLSVRPQSHAPGQTNSPSDY